MCVGTSQTSTIQKTAADRTHRAQNVPIEGRSEGRCVRLHRTFLQSKTPALDDRLYEPYGVRTAGWISLGGCQPNRVQASSPPKLRRSCRTRCIVFPCHIRRWENVLEAILDRLTLAS